MTDPNLHWDGTRWLRYDGQEWVDAGASNAPATTPVAPPSSNTTLLAIIIGGGVLVVLLIVVLVVALRPSGPPTAAPSASASVSPSASTTASPEQVAAVVSAITAVDTELTAYNKAVKTSGRTHNYAPALARLDQAQRNVAKVHSLAAQVEWPPVETETMATAAQIAAYETASTKWIDVQREIAIGLQACFSNGGTQACVDRVGNQTRAKEVKAAAAYRSAWIALGGRAQ